MTKDNHITLLAKLGIDTSNRDDVQKQINAFAKTLSGLTVNIGISKEAIKALEKLSKMDFSKFTESAKKATNEIVRTKTEVDKILKETGEALGKTDLFSGKHAITDVKNLKKALQELNPNVKVDFDVVDGQKNLKKLKASFEKDGITTHINFKQEKMSDGNGILPIWMPGQIQEVHKELSIAAKSTEEFRKRIRNLTLEGKISVDQFKELYKALKMTDVNGFGKLNADLAEMVIRNKNAAQAIRDQAKALKEQELEQKRVIENDIKRKNLITEIERAMRAQSRTFDTKAGSSLINDVLKMDRAAKDFNTTLKENQASLNRLKASATESTRSNIGLIDSFKIAMTKFPIWMAATTIFYSSIRTAREFMSIIVDIDTKMTSLAKVMSADTDFEKLFDAATASAERFGQSISQVLDAYTEFGRQGFKGQELIDLSDIGLVAANVGEITSQKAAEYLTATMIQWQMEVSNGSKVIDSWNEISNNYSTTLEKLAQGHSRAAASAKAMNIDFNQTNAIIGSLTAATKQSGTEIGNFLKNVLPRLVGQPGQDALAMVGVKLSDDDGNIRDVVEVYTEVANKVKELTEVERITVTEGLAGKHHLTRMQILLNDLGSANSLYRQMYETSVNSVGSANEENERYMNSLQARINLARVEIEKLALAMGEAFLQEGMIQSLQAFGSIMGVLSNVTGAIGALPFILATVGIAVTLLSRKLKELIGTVALTGSAFISNATKGTVFATSLKGVTASVTALGASMKALLATAGIGVALFALGAGIEYVLRNMTKMRETQEKIDAENKAVSESYLTSRDSVKALAAEYSKLNELMNEDNPSLETQQRYYEVQNELAVLMPSLISYEDSYGNSILKSSGVVDSKIKLLETQLEVEERLLAIQQAKEAKEKQELSRENVKSYNILAEDTLDNFGYVAHRYGISKGNHVYKEEIKNLQDMEKAIAHYEKMRVVYAEKGMKDTSDSMAEIADDLRERMGVYQLYTTEVEKASNYLAQVALEDAETVINAHTKMTDSAKELASNMLNDYVQAAENGEEIQIFANAFKNDDIIEVLKDTSFAIEMFKESTDDTFNGKKSELEAYGEALKEVLSTSLQDSNGVSLGKDSTEYKKAEKSIDDYITKLILAEQAARAYAEENKVSIENARAHVLAHDESGQSIANVTEEMQKYVAATKQLSSGAEQVAGVSAKLISETNDLIYSYENLTSVALRTEEQELALSETMQKLALLYPHLVKEGELRIDSLKAESKAQDILLKAVEASKKDLLTEEEEATLNQFKETNVRIGLINANIAALDNLTMAYYNLSQKAKIEFDELMGKDVKTDEDIRKIDELGKALLRLTPKAEPYATKLAELAKFEELRAGQANTMSTALERLEKEQDKSNKKTKDSIYYTDKYKQALEALNLEIEKQRALRSNMLEYSQEYRDSLQAEIKLEKDKEKLMRDQAASLQKQISSGKIKQTGTVSTSSSTGKLNGWDGTITSGFGAKESFRTSPHTGIDIAGKKGSRLDSNVSGKVVAQGFNDISGNYVKVQEANGITHFFGHLEKAIVKLNDTIEAGQQIGTIGNTGRVVSSTGDGSHVHYEVKVNNKNVDPSDYVNNAKNGLSTIITSTGEAVSNTQQSIDEAKSALVALQIELLGQQELIANGERALVNSYLSNFERRRDALDREGNYESEKLESLDVGSEAYSKTINKQISILERKKKVNEEDLVFTNELIKSGNLSSKVLAEQKIRAQELTTANLALTNSMRDLVKERIDGEQEGRQTKLDNLQEELDLSQKLLETTEKFEPTNYDKQALILDDMVASAIKYSAEVKTQKQSLDEQLAALPEGSYEWKIINELVKQYNDMLHEANVNVLTMAENLGKVKATSLIEGAKKAIDFFNQGIEALGTIDTQFERNKAADYAEKIGDALEKQLSAISERMSEINIELSTATAEDKIMALKSELKSLTEARHTIRVEVVSNIEKLISQIQAFDVGKFDKVKDVLSDDWMTIKPTTLAGQQKYNDLLKQRADALKKASDAEKANQKRIEENQKKLEEYQATMEEARLSAMLDGAHDSLKQFSKYLDVIDHQLQMIEGGESVNIPQVDYNSVPRIKPLTPEQAASQVKPPELEDPVEVEVEFVAPLTFVDTIYEAFENELKSTWKTVDITRAKLEELGSVTPENKGQFLSYIQEMKKEVADLEKFAKEAKDALKRSFDLGEISQEEYSFRLEAIQNAELEIFAIPKLQIAEEAREQLIMAGTEMANKSMNEMNERIKAQRLEIALLGDIDTSAEETKVKNALQKILDAYLAERERIIKRINEIKTALTAQITEDEKIMLQAELETLTVNLDTVAKGIDTVRKEFKGAPAAEVKVDANTALAKASIDKLNGTRVTVQVDADISAAKSAIGSLGSIGSSFGSGSGSGFNFNMPEIKINIPKIEIPKIVIPPINFSPAKSYAKGTEGHSGGQAIVGERGRELVIEPDGTAYYTGADTEIRNLPPGTQVFTAEETKRLITNRKNPIPSYADGTNHFAISEATTRKIEGILKKTLDNFLPTGLLNDISKITDKSVLLSFKSELHKGLTEGAKLLNVELLSAYNSLEKNWDGTFKNLEYAKSITDQMISNVEIQEQAQLALKNITKELYALAQAQRDRELEPLTNEKTNLEHELRLTEITNPEDVGKILSLNRQILDNTVKQTKKLKEQKAIIDGQMAGLQVGSDEWNMLKQYSDEYADSIRDAEHEVANLGNTIKETAKDAADKVIDTIKRAFEKQRDIAIASIEKQLSKLDEEYQKMMGNLDEAESDRDYEKSLQKELDAQTELRKKISILSLDSSQEGIAKRLQLEKELAEQTEKIEEMKHDRLVELKKKEITEQYEANKKVLEDEKDSVDLHYTELLDDERKFAQLREDIANGNLDEAAGTIQAFMAAFNQMNKEIANDLGQSFNSILNIIDEMTKAFGTINAVHGNAGSAMSLVNDSKSILPNISNLIPSITSAIPAILKNIATTTSSFMNPNETNYNLTLNIASLNGTEADGENLAQTIMNTLKKMGK